MINISQNTILAKNIKSIRQDMGLTMEEFGKKFKKNAHKSIVSKWEQGKTQPSNERLKEIAGFGNMSVSQLLYGDFLARLENITHDKILTVLYDNDFNDYDDYDDFYNKLRDSVSGIILSFYERGEDAFDLNLFTRLLNHYLQLELDLGDRDLDSLTEFAFRRTMNAQELVVEYHDDSKAKEFLTDKNIDEFLTTISDKYDDILHYIDDYRKKNNLDNLIE
nr:helix-turn-helix transcriptional regulator [Staphylococcus xylosus]